MNKWIKVLLLITVVIVIANLFSFSKDYTEEVFQFDFQSDLLEGSLYLPKDCEEGQTDIPLVIFVHGDGDLRRDAHGYYRPIWSILTQNGIACMSWDKKGVGKSTGNWLSQSMEDRAWETITAIEFAKSELGFEKASIGLMGFSQAGWVLPRVVSASDYPDFMISVSPAINWKTQSNFLTQARKEREGADKQEISLALERNQESFRLFEDHIKYDDYVSMQHEFCKELEKTPCSVIDEQRYYFIQKNIDSDASRDIQDIHCPIMLMLGADDLNIDYAETREVYKTILSNNNHDFTSKVYPETTHGLLKSAKFNYQTPGLAFLMKYRFYKENAFADDVLADMVNFVKSNQAL